MPTSSSIGLPRAVALFVSKDRRHHHHHHQHHCVFAIQWMFTAVSLMCLLISPGLDCVHLTSVPFQQGAFACWLALDTSFQSTSAGLDTSLQRRMAVMAVDGDSVWVLGQRFKFVILEVVIWQDFPHYIPMSRYRLFPQKPFCRLACCVLFWLLFCQQKDPMQVLKHIAFKGMMAKYGAYILVKNL